MTSSQLKKSIFLVFVSLEFLFLHTEAQVVINEYSVSNLSTIQDNYSEYEDWVELYNPGSSAANIGGYFMSDDTASPLKWVIPAGVIIPSGGFLLVWASGRNEVAGGHYHTNFRLTQTKANPDWIVLTYPSGTILEQRQLEITQVGHSRGRTANGGGTWGIFTNPTPGYSNNNAVSYTRYAAIPTFSLTGGYYTGSVEVTMTTDEQNAQIRYTLNGFEPTASSTLYTNPVPVPSTKILKARVISNIPGVLPGLIEFDTYFINEYTTLPVLSIAGDDVQNLLNGNQMLRSSGSIEFFNKNKARTTTAYGEFNEHGQDSWIHPQRSIDYITRDECGYNYALQEKFFSMSDRDEFQRVIIRAAGDDNYPGIDTSAHMRDDFVETLSQKAGQHLDWRKSERCVLYANGTYWGIYAIREKVHDHDYTLYYYDQGKYDIQFIMLWGYTWAEYGGQQALDDWYALHDFIMNHDMSNSFNYWAVAAQYDITSLVDYIIINSYVVCSDWLNWNVGWWRGLNNEGSHRKWAYILWDEDATFGHYINYTGIPAQSPYIPPCYPEDLTAGWQDPEGHVAVLNQLRNNPEFDQYYISRYIDLLNVAFNDEFMLNLLDSMAMIIQPEMPAHTQRWGGSVSQWLSNVQRIRDFITTRNSIIEDGLKECYSLTGSYDLVIDAQPSGSGKVKINSLELHQYPWEGKYFGGVDVRLKALETNPNYEFDRWALLNHTVTPADTVTSVVLDLFTGDSVVAMFKPRIYTDSLVINEINYNSAAGFDPGDWVEFYNPHDHVLNISNWIFRDDDDQHGFVFPEGTSIDPDGYLVICRDTAAFHNLFPDVLNYLGTMDFGLSANGELIRLYDNTGIMIDTVHFDDQEPWPTEPDGNGPTLELINPTFDNALSESWSASELNGTPGKINGSFVKVPEPYEDKSVTCRIYPNPFNSSAIFSITTDGAIKEATLAIYNILGKEIKLVENISSNHFVISGDQLPAGVCIYKLFDKNYKLLTTGKFIVAGH